MNMKKILIINGPNLNLLGNREKNFYGETTLEKIKSLCEQQCKINEIECDFFQSNHEGEIIEKIHSVDKGFDGIIINPAAFTHYSYAIRDAITAVEIPAVEVHLTDLRNREEFRHISVISSVCLDQVSGLGKDSYLEGLNLLLKLIG